WSGARDIVAELISDHPEVRRITREKALKFGEVRAGKIEDAEDEKAVFALYYDFTLRLERIRPHQILALNRGEALKILRVAIDVPERDWQQAINTYFPPNPASRLAEQLSEASQDAAERLLLPAIERDVR